MKNLFLKYSIIICLMIIPFASSAQEFTSYDFLEVIVIQKMNNSGKIKRIKVEDQESLQGKVITIKQMEALQSTSALLNYMNAHQWEYVDRRAVTEEKEPVWMSYIFRKKK